MKRLFLLLFLLAAPAWSQPASEYFRSVTLCTGEGCGLSFCLYQSGDTTPELSVCTGTARVLDVTGGVLFVAAKVGIGIAAPVHELDVLGIARITGTSADNTQLRFAGATAGNLFAIGTDINAGDGADEWEVFSLLAGASRILVDASGFVGIDTTSPIDQFEVVLEAGEASCLTTASGTACDFGLLATAPATCTATGDEYKDTFPTWCACFATNTWTDVLTGLSPGNCV